MPGECKETDSAPRPKAQGPCGHRPPVSQSDVLPRALPRMEAPWAGLDKVGDSGGLCPEVPSNPDVGRGLPFTYTGTRAQGELLGGSEEAPTFVVAEGN